MQESSRYYRFDAVTVRAATRLMRLSCLGGMPLRDLHYYLRLLAVMEPAGVEAASRKLGRMALRRASLGHTGVRPVFGLRRGRPGTNRAQHCAARHVSRAVPSARVSTEQVERLLRSFR